MSEHEANRNYIEHAKEELDLLKRRIEGLEAKHAGAHEKLSMGGAASEEIDWNKIHSNLRARANQIGCQLEELGERIKNVDIKDMSQRLGDLKSTSETRLSETWKRGGERWSDLQSKAETGFWDLRAAVQRISEGLRPYVGQRGQGEKARYFLEKAQDGRWALVLEGSHTPTMHFNNKSVGLKESRRYVRDQRPSELVVRRSDGTFEKVHNYPS